MGYHDTIRLPSRVSSTISQLASVNLTLFSFFFNFSRRLGLAAAVSLSNCTVAGPGSAAASNAAAAAKYRQQNICLA
jgi:hypothetical protein